VRNHTQEKVSGTSVQGRDELNTLLEFLREGDELVVCRVDRLARSIRDLQNIVYDLNKRGVVLSATEQPIDTRTSVGKCFLDMLGVFGEFETNLGQERQMEGIAKAKEKGVYKRRKPSVDVVRVKELRVSGMGASAIAKEMGIGRASVYRALGLVLLNTLCISYGRILGRVSVRYWGILLPIQVYGRVSVRFQVGMASSVSQRCLCF
jgi:DNA invertase Pin-like site-specific DNA recombinase